MSTYYGPGAVCSRPWESAVLSKQNRFPSAPPLLPSSARRGLALEQRSDARILKMGDFQTQRRAKLGGQGIFRQERGCLACAHSIFLKQSLLGLGCPRGSTVPQEAGHSQGSESPIPRGFLEGEACKSHFLRHPLTCLPPFLGRGRGIREELGSPQG